MSRAERRRAQKCEQKAKTATYNLTRAQLDALVREKISGELDRVKQEATNDAINQAMILLLTLQKKRRGLQRPDSLQRD